MEERATATGSRAEPQCQPTSALSAALAQLVRRNRKDRKYDDDSSASNRVRGRRKNNDPVEQAGCSEHRDGISAASRASETRGR